MYHLDQTADDIFEGEVELDESYFGGTRKGNVGVVLVEKSAVFGILKRGGMVYVKVVPDTQSDTLMPALLHVK